MKKIFSLCFAIILLFPCVSGYSAVAATDSIKYSEVDYRVFYNASEDVFLCNKKDIGSEVGTMYFMTYTVKSVTNPGATQQGIIGTADCTRSYPFTDGGYMKYAFSKDLLMEGYTYFIKFTITDDGYSYKIARAKDSESEYVYMPIDVGDKTDKMKYFGLWLGVGKVSAELIKVRCYDAAGNDLGVQAPSLKASIISEKKKEKDKSIDHKYTITAKELSNVAISNLLPIESNKMYMEYTVKESHGNLYQSGLICSDYPNENYPFGKGGSLHQEELQEEGVGALLTPGAEYVIDLTKGTQAFSGVVQKTLAGKTEYFVFPIKFGTFDQNARYFSLWFGEGDTHKISFVLENYKCYDENKKNLKVQCNKSVLIKHIGALEDYSGCEAFYYSDSDDSFYVLNSDQKFNYHKASVEYAGKYIISSGKISVKFNDGRNFESPYKYQTFTDSDGNKYRRLYTYKVRFVTGSDTNIPSQTVNLKNSYILSKPEDPVLKNNTFIEWCTEDGKSFDFNQYITKSLTLYAKWKNSAGNEYISVGGTAEKNNYIPYISISIGVALIIAGVSVAVVFLKKGKKYAEKQ